MYYQYNSTKEVIIQELKNSGIMFKQGLSGVIWFMDNSGMKAIIAGMLEHPLIIGVQVFDQYKDRIGAGGIFQNTEGKYVEFQDRISVEPDEEAEPFKSGDHPITLIFSHTFQITYYDKDEAVVQNIGNATIYSSGRFIFERLKGSYGLLMLKSLLVALALILVSLWKSRIILAQPLSLLTNAVTSLHLKNLDSLEVNLPTSEQNELKVLETAFNHMVKNLVEEQQANIHMTGTFEKFIPKQLLIRIATHGIHSISTGGIVKEKMTVLYCRINSEEVSEHFEAADIFNFKYLNKYLSKMNKAIEKHGGFVYKYSNDNIMAFFDLNDPPLEALSSVYAAIDMQKAVRTFNQEQTDQGYLPISISIGIDSGEIWLGTIGSENRIEATGIGSAIGTAIRLQDLTYKYQSQILITENILTLLKSFNACLIREVESISISKTGRQIKVFEVFDAEPVREIKQKLLPFFQEGLHLFQAGRWEEAKAHFEACLKIYPTDAVSQIYFMRCQQYENDNKITVFLRNECKLSPILREAENIDRLAGEFKLVTFENNDCIMKCGEPGLHFYLLFDGNADVFVKKEDGSDLKVATLKKGEGFGELSLLTGDLVSATITSVGTSRVLAVNRTQFDVMVRQYPKLNHYFHAQYSKYMADLQAAVLK